MAFTWINNGGVTSSMGFCSSGISAGIKAKGKKDMALVVSDCEAMVGAVFTTNQIKAAPVKVSMKHATRGKVRAVVFNSGNANACTGVQGIKDARSMAETTAKELGCKDTQILVCSTGRIGIPLPMPKITKGIPKLVQKLSHYAGHSTAKAIMTTDTFPKECAVNFKVGGKNVVLGGMAKGAGMIHPNMATMLSCITTDVVIDKNLLRQCVKDAVDHSFNRISVDGDTSTNDTVIVLANGMAKNAPLKKGDADLAVFQAALLAVMRKLARMIVEDGESITRVVELIVRGAVSEVQAKQVADAIAHSPLVKSSWAGGDPNWGRLMDVIGYSGAKVREELVDIFYDGNMAVKGGVFGKVPMSRLKKITARRSFAITIDLHLGNGCYDLLVNDLTEGYVAFNMGD